MCINNSMHLRTAYCCASPSQSMLSSACYSTGQHASVCHCRKHAVCADTADMFAALLQDSFLDEGFILDKKIGVGQPHRITDAKVLIANTPMDTDKIKIYGARVRVDSMAKVGMKSHARDLAWRVVPLHVCYTTFSACL